MRIKINLFLILFFLSFSLLPVQFQFEIEGKDIALQDLKTIFPRFFSSGEWKGKLSPRLRIWKENSLLRVEGENTVRDFSYTFPSPLLQITAEEILMKNIKLSRGEKLEFSLDLEASKITCPFTQALPSLRASVRYENKEMFLDNLRLSCGEGFLLVSGRIPLSGKEKFSLRGRGERIAMDYLFPESPYRGKISLEFDLQGYLASPSSYNGTAYVHIKEGELAKIPYLLDIFSLLFRGKFERISMSSLEASFKVKDGFAYTEDLRMWGKGVSLSAKGYIGWNRKVDLLVSFYFTQELLKFTPLTHLVGIFIDRLGNALVRVRLSGTLSNPRYTVVPLPLGEEVRNLLEKFFQQKR